MGIHLDRRGYHAWTKVGIPQDWSGYTLPYYGPIWSSTEVPKWSGTEVGRPSWWVQRWMYQFTVERWALVRPYQKVVSSKYLRNNNKIIILTYRWRLCIKTPPTHLTNKTEINRNRTFEHAKHTISTNTSYESYSFPLWCGGPFQKFCVAHRQGLTSLLTYAKDNKPICTLCP